MVGAINIEYENIKFENGNIEKQSGELLSQMLRHKEVNLTEPNLS